MSLPQALFTLGLACGLLVALTLGERWLTRRGVLNAGPAVAAGVGAWVLASLTVGLFVGQVAVGYGAMAWGAGPAVANEALLEYLSEVSLPLCLFVGIATTPVGLTFGGYVYSWTAAEAQTPASLASLVVSVAWGVVLLLLGLVAAATRDLTVNLVGHAFFAAVGIGMVVLVSWLSYLVSIALALGGLAVCGRLEERWFRARTLRWDSDVKQGTRAPAWGIGVGVNQAAERPLASPFSRPRDG